MTAPQDLPYTIAGRDLVAEISGMRVQVLTLFYNEKVPWHFHSTVYDIFIGVEGTTIVETKAPRARYELSPGDHCVVAPRTAHEVSNKSAARCRFTIVQGVGAHDFNTLANTSPTDESRD